MLEKMSQSQRSFSISMSNASEPKVHSLQLTLKWYILLDDIIGVRLHLYQTLPTN